MAPRENAGKVLTAPATRLGGQAVPPSPRRTIPGWRGRLGRGSGSGPRYKDVDGDVKNDSRTLYTDPTDRPPWHSDGFAPGGRRAIAGISPTGGSQFAQPPPRLALSQGRGKMMSATQRDCSQVATPRPWAGPDWARWLHCESNFGGGAGVGRRRGVHSCCVCLSRSDPGRQGKRQGVGFQSERACETEQGWPRARRRRGG